MSTEPQPLFDMSKAQPIQDQTAPAPSVPLFDMAKAQPIQQTQQQSKPDTGVFAGIKRNTVDALTGLYHAFNDPATEQEKAELLQKVRDANAKGDKVPEELATSPSRATLALHRIVDAPAALLLKKGRDEVGVAQDLINNHQYWRGGNMYLSGLTDKLLSAVPVIGPGINSIAERGEHGDVSGAATDVAALIAAEHAPAIVKGTGKAVGKAVEAVGEIPGKLKNTVEAVTPESLTKRPATPVPQHGAPVTVESPLDSATVGRQLGGKDLSQEALDSLQKHVGDKIPVGSSAKNTLMKAVEPVSKAISDTASKMNDVVKDAPKFTTSVMQDSVFGEGKFTNEIESLKKNTPASVRDTVAQDIDAVVEDADKALNSTDPTEALEYRRQLGKQIDWDKIEKNPSTPSEAQNLARAKVYKAIGDKIHAEIPETAALDKNLQPNLELRSHMRTKLGDRVVDDPHAATVESQTEFKKGQQTIENAAHNEAVAKRWNVIVKTLTTLGYSGLGAEILKHLVP